MRVGFNPLYCHFKGVLVGHSTCKKRSVIVTGHPGIGRTMGSVGQTWVLINFHLSRQNHLVKLHLG